MAQRTELRRRIAPLAERTIGVGLATASVDAPASVEQQREQEAGSRRSPHDDVGVAASVRPALKRKSSEPLALVKRFTNVRALVSAAAIAFKVMIVKVRHRWRLANAIGT